MAKKTRKQKQRSATRLRPTSPQPRSGATTPGGRADGSRLPAADHVGAGVTPLSDLTQGSARGGLGAVADPASDDALAATQPIASTGRRRVERVTPVAQGRAASAQVRGPANSAAAFQPLNSDDAAIPFDRVPYVPRDLRRVAIMAAVMVVLIVIAAVVVTRINP